MAVLHPCVLSLRFYLSVRGMLVSRDHGLQLYLCSQDGSINSTLSPVVKGAIALSINIKYNTNTIQNKYLEV